MNFIKKLIGIEDTSKIVEEKLSLFKDKMIEEISVLKTENAQLKTDKQSQQSKIVELTGKLRDQNEADLFLECEKIKKKILDGEKKPDTNSYKQLAAQQQYYASMQSNQQYGFLLGGCGSGIFL